MSIRKKIGPFLLHFDGEEVRPHEVGDELIWRCPVTGTTFHMERMDDNHFWFRFDVRERPDGPDLFGLHCGVYQPEGGRLQLFVEGDRPVIDGDHTAEQKAAKADNDLYTKE